MFELYWRVSVSVLLCPWWRVHVSVLQEIALEAAFPRSATCRLHDSYVKRNSDIILSLGQRSSCHPPDLGIFSSGSRADGLSLEDNWGHDPADQDDMILKGGSLGVFVPGTEKSKPQRSTLTFCPDSCPHTYTLLEVIDICKLRERCKNWFHDDCVHESGGRLWLNTYNTLSRLQNTSGLHSCDAITCGPAAQSFGGSTESVFSLICSNVDPNLEQEFRWRPRRQWPPIFIVNNILHMPMLLVLVGHKHSPDYKLQARISWSHYEYCLMREVPENVRQGYIACKYVLKRFLGARRAPHGVDYSRSHVSSYHIKTTFLHFLAKRPPAMITSPFRLFSSLLRELDGYLMIGKLPHFFQAQCNLLETVDDDERHIAHQVISDILSEPIKALLTSPTRPQQIYGEVRPEALVEAFNMVSDHPMREQSWKDLSKLLSLVDERRRQRYCEQQEKDIEVVSGRSSLTVLVDLLRQTKED